MAYRDQVNRTVDWMTASVEKAWAESMNVAVATLICCYSEALGAHLRACQKEAGESALNFTAFLRSYMSALMASCRDAGGTPKVKTVRVNREHATPQAGNRKALEYPEILYKLFRCGFAHEFLSKYGTGIIKDNDTTKYPFLIDDDPAYDLVVNLSQLVPDFVDAAGRFRGDVLADHQVPLIELAGTTLVMAGQQWDRRGEFLLRK